MRHCLVLLLCFFALGRLPAQNLPSLSAYYSFEGTLEDVSGNTANEGLPEGAPDFACGYLTGAGLGESVRFGETLSGMAVVGPVTDEFNTEDITISWYMRPSGTGGVQHLLAKRKVDCSRDSSLLVQYFPAERRLQARFTETPAKEIVLEGILPDDQCWHHVLLRREATRIQLFINGAPVDEGATAGLIDLSNDGDLVLAGSDCSQSGATPYEGFIDELAIFSSAIDLDQAGGLLLFPQRILTPDTQLFLGESLTVAVGPSCPARYAWTPGADLDDPTAAEPTITPTQAGLQTYALAISDGQTTCVARDTLQIQVIDPDDLDCNRLFLPTAFTPNGDGQNDGFGISNPFAVQEMKRLEIFDRWGSRVFVTTDAFERWNGTFRGEPLNPGVLLYRLETICDGEERLQTGTVTLIR